MMLMLGWETKLYKHTFNIRLDVKEGKSGLKLNVSSGINSKQQVTEFCFKAAIEIGIPSKNGLCDFLEAEYC